MSHLSLSASVDAGDAVSVACQSANEDNGETTVLVNLSPFLMVRINDPAVLDALVAQLTEARDWLTIEVTEQTPPPMVPEPVGDTGLFLHPLPVGQA